MEPDGQGQPERGKDALTQAMRRGNLVRRRERPIE